MLINYSRKIQDIFLEMLQSWKQVDIQDVKRMAVIKGDLNETWNEKTKHKEKH